MYFNIHTSSESVLSLILFQKVDSLQRSNLRASFFIHGLDWSLMKRTFQSMCYHFLWHVWFRRLWRNSSSVQNLKYAAMCMCVCVRAYACMHGHICVNSGCKNKLKHDKSLSWQTVTCQKKSVIHSFLGTRESEYTHTRTRAHAHIWAFKNLLAPWDWSAFPPTTTSTPKTNTQKPVFAWPHFSY